MWGFLKIYLVAFGVFLVIEGIWLMVVAKEFYQKELGLMMSKSPKILPTVIFSLIFVAGLVFFVIDPALVKNSREYALFIGFFYGLISYSTYDLTNLATLANWPLKVTVVDLIWGSSMGTLVSTITFFLVKLFS